MRSISLATLLLALPALSLQGASGVDIKIDPDLQKKLQRFEAALEGLRQEHHIGGLSAAVVKDGQVVYLKGLGVTADGRDVTPDTAYPIPSLQRLPDQPWTVRQLAQVDVITGRGAILEKRPYLAWHVEGSGEERLQWAAEREEGNALLYLKAPAKRLTLILLANGPLERSVFTEAFLKTFS